MTIKDIKKVYYDFMEGERFTFTQEEYTNLVLYLKKIDMYDLYRVNLLDLTIKG